MAYIGREPQIGNFQVCDAITVVDAQAAYTMQVATVDVFPETANHMLVSLNGILQAPTTSFTVSGSTITFASALETGDVIDFIQILGNVLDLGVPSDDTVTTAKIVDANVTLAKLSATGTKDATTFLRGDNTFNGVASLSTASGSAPSYSARAWVNFNGTGTPAIRGSGNVSSVTDGGTAEYTVNFSTNLPDTNYAVVASTHKGGGAPTTANNAALSVGETRNIGSCLIEAFAGDLTTRRDAPSVYAVFLR
jgi:hypothetical protein